MISSRTRVQAVKLLQTVRFASQKASEEGPLYLNPHAWKGLPADQIFELHNLRKDSMGEKYNPSDEERNAILSTITSLVKNKPELGYTYEIDNFKERFMNNTPSNLKGLPPKKSNTYVIDQGSIPHQKRRIEQLTRISAYEMPLLAKFRQPYTPPVNSQSPIKLTYNTDFSDETSNKINRSVQLKVNLTDLKLNDKQQHNFKILSGNKFNHDTNIFSLKTDQYPEAIQNARFLVDTLNKLITESKDAKNDFSDIPLDKRHMKQLHNKPAPQFPESWKRPEDSPIARHKIVNRLVEVVKDKKDNEYISNLSP
ncbi:mitochondrial ribosome small subunit component [Scheffersomyces coipomensis]|uniref:mitochondrial ribosome small subunit component n=1 Tax=Scheffersomyces coipomensis TaxID=1788519 RepID=UPI00315D5A19